MNNCQKSYFFHADVTVDEQLFPCRSRLVCIYDKRFNIILHLSLFILIFLRKQLEIYRVNIYTNDCLHKE